LLCLFIEFSERERVRLVLPTATWGQSGGILVGINTSTLQVKKKKGEQWIFC
jgi:hypothetical protein